MFWEGGVDEGFEEGLLVQRPARRRGRLAVVAARVGPHEVEDIEHLELFAERFSRRWVVGVVGLGADAGKE